MAKTAPETTRRARVLIVDDHPIVRRGLGYLLARQPDLEVCAEASGWDEAVERLRGTPADVAVVDIQLGGRNGINLIHHLRAIAPSLRILVLSVLADDAFVERALRAGADGYVFKDSGAPAILEALRAVLAGRTHLPRGTAARLLAVCAGRRAEPGDGTAGLTTRQLEVLELTGRGLGPAAIAAHLRLAEATVHSHRASLMRRLKLGSAAELIGYATVWFNGGGTSPGTAQAP